MDLAAVINGCNGCHSGDHERKQINVTVSLSVPSSIIQKGGTNQPSLNNPGESSDIVCDINGDYYNGLTS